MIETTLCEICNSTSLFWKSINKYSHYRCRKCSHLFVMPRPSQLELDLFYQRGEYYHSAEEQSERIISDSHAREALLSQLINKYRLSKELLDVGCASGFFLQVMKNHGWSVTGQDRSATIAAKAREITGRNVVDGIFEEIEIKGSPFSVVASWEVIEHTLDPREFFKALSKNVKKGGLLALSTPLSTGIPARVLGTRYPMLIPPEHLSLFSRKSLNHLATEFGFEEVHYSSFSNLNTTSLSNGFSKLIFNQSLDSSSFLKVTTSKVLGILLSIFPVIIDKIGLGTEMQIVYRKVS